MPEKIAIFFKKMPDFVRRKSIETTFQPVQSVYRAKMGRPLIGGNPKET
jgi:hypothetical protein